MHGRAFGHGSRTAGAPPCLEGLPCRVAVRPRPDRPLCLLRPVSSRVSQQRGNNIRGWNWGWRGDAGTESGFWRSCSVTPACDFKLLTSTF